MTGPNAIGNDLAGETIALQARHLGWKLQDKTLDAPRCIGKLAMPIQEIHREMKATRRKIPYAVLFTQSRAAVKSRTARHIAAQFRQNPKIDTFDVEIHERDAFAAIFSIGGAVSQLDPKKVNGLSNALENMEGFRSEVIHKLRTLASEGEGRAVA